VHYAEEGSEGVSVRWARKRKLLENFKSASVSLLESEEWVE
jgi:hypothetical protein